MKDDLDKHSHIRDIFLKAFYDGLLTANEFNSDLENLGDSRSAFMAEVVQDLSEIKFDGIEF